MEKILVVEDNKTLSSILKQRLEIDGFSVDIVGGGFALLAYLRDGKEPDAVILDLFIPEKSGLELLDSLNNKWKNTKIFVYTAQANLKAICLRYPTVCRFFTKTEDMQFLIEAIKDELRARQG
ncbi:MAG: response regulator [Verrucomicrobia bacterium]|nr:response regulator [Verrucomicrobiota bacterium]